jgi:hypothetical protein
MMISLGSVLSESVLGERRHSRRSRRMGFVHQMAHAASLAVRTVLKRRGAGVFAHWFHAKLICGCRETERHVLLGVPALTARRPLGLSSMAM